MLKVKSTESRATLYHDNSKEALKLEQNLRAIGYDLTVKLSGSAKPIFSSDGCFLAGYCQIRRSLGCYEDLFKDNPKSL